MAIRDMKSADTRNWKQWTDKFFLGPLTQLQLAKRWKWRGAILSYVRLDPGRNFWWASPQKAHFTDSPRTHATSQSSPEGSTLFVNIQGAGMTLAITGPWRGVKES